MTLKEFNKLKLDYLEGKNFVGIKVTWNEKICQL